jgi:hypothetical protein
VPLLPAPPLLLLAPLPPVLPLLLALLPTVLPLLLALLPTVLPLLLALPPPVLPLLLALLPIVPLLAPPTLPLDPDEPLAPSGAASFVSELSVQVEPLRAGEEWPAGEPPADPADMGLAPPPGCALGAIAAPPSSGLGAPPSSTTKVTSGKPHDTPHAAAKAGHHTAILLSLGANADASHTAASHAECVRARVERGGRDRRARRSFRADAQGPCRCARGGDRHDKNATRTHQLRQS